MRARLLTRANIRLDQRVAPKLLAAMIGRSGEPGGARSQALRDYEQGYVKEGVGAGGLALLWERCGHSPEALAVACDALCRQWLGA